MIINRYLSAPRKIGKATSGLHFREESQRSSGPARALAKGTVPLAKRARGTCWFAMVDFLCIIQAFLHVLCILIASMTTYRESCLGMVAL